MRRGSKKKVTTRTNGLKEEKESARPCAATLYCANRRATVSVLHVIWQYGNTTLKNLKGGGRGAVLCISYTGGLLVTGMDCVCALKDRYTGGKWTGSSLYDTIR